VQRKTFTWLVSEEILDEYKRVLGRLRVRRNRIGSIINLLRYRSIAEHRPTQQTIHFATAQRWAAPIFIVTLNPKDFPQERLHSRVIAPNDRL
jgi:hypothetical protein